MTSVHKSLWLHCDKADAAAGNNRSAEPINTCANIELYC